MVTHNADFSFDAVKKKIRSIRKINKGNKQSKGQRRAGGAMHENQELDARLMGDTKIAQLRNRFRWREEFDKN